MKKATNIGWIHWTGQGEQGIYPRKRLLKKRRKLFPDVELEKFPFEKAFRTFTENVRQLDAEPDVVNGITREYVSTSRLYPHYKKAFAEHALEQASVNYRLNRIHAEEFPGDFMALQFTAGWEPKYYINRLNNKLLKKIYMPELMLEIKMLAERTAYLESLVRYLLEIENHNEAEEF